MFDMHAYVQSTYLGLYLVGVVFCNDLLHGSRDEDVAVLVHETFALVLARTWEPIYGTRVNAELFQSLNINTKN